MPPSVIVSDTGSRFSERSLYDSAGIPAFEPRRFAFLFRHDAADAVRSGNHITVVKIPIFSVQAADSGKCIAFSRCMHRPLRSSPAVQISRLVI